MAGTGSCSAGGEDTLGKDIDNQGLVDLVAVRDEFDGTVRKYQAPRLHLQEEGNKQMYEKVLPGDTDVQVLVESLSDKDDDEKVLSDKEEDEKVLFEKVYEDKGIQVIGWDAETGTSLREVRKYSQALKGRTAALKKGLGFFCYRSFGAYRSKF